MTKKQTRVIGISARLLRDTYCNQGDSLPDARDKAVKAFRDHLDETRRPMKRRLKGVGTAVDAVGLVALALKGVGLEKPDPRTAETIFATAEKALKEVML